MRHLSSIGLRTNPVAFALVVAGMMSLTSLGGATIAYAASAGVAMPSGGNSMSITGSGNAAYPSSATTGNTPPSNTNNYAGQASQAAPSVAAPSGSLINLDGNTGSGSHANGSNGGNGNQPAAPLQPPTTTSSGINIPSPPPPSAFSTDPNQIAAQAEQAALQAQAQADIDEHKREQEHNVKSFDKAASGLLPMSSDQIREFMHKLEQTQNAAQSPYDGTPKGQTRIATLSLDPGVEPPQVNLSSGFVTTITMVDATGEPWPILDVGVGGSFEVSPTQSGTHVVRIMPLTRVGTGDLSVLLKDLPTPVIFRLSAGGPTVDLRYDARIAKMGPGAKPQIIARPRLEAGDETLTLILENAPPSTATRMKIGGLDARTKAWSVADKVYVRTPLSLLSPAWNASVSSADGTTVYEIGDAPVLLMSDNGAVVRAQISRDDDHDK